MKKTTRLRNMIGSKSLSFLLEAHNGISAKIVEEAGFEGIWGSGLTLSASLGVRDNNEASWTQVLEMVEFMSDAVSIPMLLDGDTGYGNFNNFSRVVRKLEQRGCAGVCIEDKLFPKTNSFIEGEKQALADMDEFAGKIKAGKDVQDDPDFVIVARIEAFIAGRGLKEALTRAEAYRQAGADAILVHSKLSNAEEVLSFMDEWCDRLPVVIVPTKYYSTPTEVFANAGISVVIWANHLLRAAVATMQQDARKLYEAQSLTCIEDEIATVSELFRLQGADDLREREDVYLPRRQPDLRGVILAASQGAELQDLTADKPKALISVGGQTILDRTIGIMNAVGIDNISVVRGFAKEQIQYPGLSLIDNDAYDSTQEGYSLSLAMNDASGPMIISYGDILYKKYVLRDLLESDEDITVVVDSEWQRSQNAERYADFTVCNLPHDRETFHQRVLLQKVVNCPDNGSVTGEWIGLMRLSAKGTEIVKAALGRYPDDSLCSLRMRDLLNKLIDGGQEVAVQYIHHDWLDIDDLYDLARAEAF